ncbi:hypothetical protein HOY82DRAFT_557014, partial [Tuber indicum]
MLCFALLCCTQVYSALPVSFGTGRKLKYPFQRTDVHETLHFLLPDRSLLFIFFSPKRLSPCLHVLVSRDGRDARWSSSHTLVGLPL